uniref:Uncharacterized protein n=1 Tax=Penaeus semisulcatus majanivirus TaxID=2984274 RepID=A0A9C7BLZ2_9VIRU|nr:MAG: hypothetical protein [Penaeus semisulcatus majanivirus]
MFSIEPAGALIFSTDVIRRPRQWMNSMKCNINDVDHIATTNTATCVVVDNNILTLTKLQPNKNSEMYNRKRVFINAYWLLSSSSSLLLGRDTRVTDDDNGVEEAESTSTPTTTTTTSTIMNYNDNYNVKNNITKTATTTTSAAAVAEPMTTAANRNGIDTLDDMYPRMHPGNPQRTSTSVLYIYDLNKSQLTALNQRPLFDLEDGIIGRVLQFM